MRLFYSPDRISDCASVLCALYSGLQEFEIIEEFVPLKDGVFRLQGGQTLPESMPMLLHLISLSQKKVQNVLLSLDNEDKKAQVDQWIKTVTEKRFDCTNEETLRIIENQAAHDVFLTGAHITLADLLVFASVHAWVAKMTPSQKIAYPSLLRWFNYLQHLPGIHNMEDNPFAYINIEPMATFDLHKKEISPAENVVIPTSPNKEADTKTIEPAESKRTDIGGKKKKEKKQPEVKQVQNERPLDDPTRLNLVVAQIVEVKEHPDADGLYIERIISGTTEYNVVSNLRKHIPIEEMQNARCVILTNFPPKKLRGIMSEAMVMCASDEGKIELLQPPSDARSGERILFGNLDGEPDPELSIKSKTAPFPRIQPHFKIESDGTAWFKDAQLHTRQGPCRSITLTKGSLS